MFEENAINSIWIARHPRLRREEEWSPRLPKMIAERLLPKCSEGNHAVVISTAIFPNGTGICFTTAVAEKLILAEGLVECATESTT